MSTPRDVLLVEDNPGDVLLFEETVHDAMRRGLDKVEVHHVERIADARAWLREHPEPLAVFCDLGLPDATGLDAVDQLLAEDPTLTVIVLSGSDDPALTERALESGAQDWMVKSAEIDGTTLGRTLRHAASRARGRRELLRSRQELQRFAHVVAHDIKGPLSVIAGTLRLVEQTVELDDPDMEDMVGRAARAAVRLGEMTDGLLAYADADGADVDQVVYLGDVIDWVRGLVKPRVLEVGGQCVVQDDLPAVRGNLAGLRQVVLNLVSNAVKYRSPDRPLHVSMAADRRDDGMVDVIVSDNGIGIPVEDRARVFEPGLQLGPEEEGIGLGLAAVRHVVERHRGTIRVTSGPDGHGTTVTVSLPSSDRPAPG